jgi:hypothetical protein
VLGEEQEGVLCVIPQRKLYDVTELIHSVDPHAFITVTQIREVRGRGFTEERIPISGGDAVAAAARINSLLKILPFTFLCHLIYNKSDR